MASRIALLGAHGAGASGRLDDVLPEEDVKSVNGSVDEERAEEPHVRPCLAALKEGGVHPSETPKTVTTAGCTPRWPCPRTVRVLQSDT